MTVSTGGGAAIGGNVDSGRDVAGRDHDDRSMNLVFAPSEATLRPGVVYTIQEMFAAMEKELDEHGHQLQAIWAKLSEESPLKINVNALINIGKLRGWNVYAFPVTIGGDT